MSNYINYAKVIDPTTGTLLPDLLKNIPSSSIYKSIETGKYYTKTDAPGQYVEIPITDIPMSPAIDVPIKNVQSLTKLYELSTSSPNAVTLTRPNNNYAEPSFITGAETLEQINNSPNKYCMCKLPGSEINLDSLVYTISFDKKMYDNIDTDGRLVDLIRLQKAVTGSTNAEGLMFTLINNDIIVQEFVNDKFTNISFNKLSKPNVVLDTFSVYSIEIDNATKQITLSIDGKAVASVANKNDSYIACLTGFANKQSYKNYSVQRIEDKRTVAQFPNWVPSYNSLLDKVNALAAQTRLVRYIRDETNGNIDSPLYNTWTEIQAYTGDGTNVALHKPVTIVKGAELVSTIKNDTTVVTNGDTDMINDAQHILDFQQTTNPVALQIDLGAAYELLSIKVWHFNNAALNRKYKNHILSVSEDGTNWSVIWNSNALYEEVENTAGLIYRI